MAFLAPVLRPRAPLIVRRAAVISTRGFRATSLRAALSEDDTHREDDRKSHIDKHKDDSVSKAKAGNAEWKRELASSSEAAVKADREDLDASEENIKKLQKETENMAKQSK